jgi:glucose-6-phosphate 1-dehydrogenase
MPATLTAVENTIGEVDAYERLLDDAMHGDSMLFVREDAVEAAWAIVDPVLQGQQSGTCVHARLVGAARNGSLSSRSRWLV